jgi:two-component system cell cycle sensor histidine kinase/response regulator CckA
MIVDVGESLLSSLGYEVIAADSGPNAVAIYKKMHAQIDLVLLDMIMPGMGGGKVYRRLAEIESDVKVVLSSGYSIDGRAKEILDMGCNGFIQKPFSIDGVFVFRKE